MSLIYFMSLFHYHGCWMHIAVAVARKSRAMCEFRLVGTMYVCSSTVIKC